MKSSVASACCLALLVAACVALPMAQPAAPQDVEILEQAQETLHTLDLGEPNSDVSARDKRTIGFLRETFPSLTEDSVVSRVVRATATKDQEAEASEPINDQDAAAADDTDNRDKRFLFGLGGGEGGGSGSAGGSGNFLFDIIRLIAGSGTTEEAADAGTGHSASGAGGYSEGSVASAIGEAPEVGGDGIKDDGYTSGIPGPITRLFIIANRGVSNLIQDLILRLAQTSERIVNFKARLITSII